MKTLILPLLLCLVFAQVQGQNVGIQQPAPASRLDVNGNLTIGSGYSGTAAPADGAIIEGDLGVGTDAPVARLDANGTWKLGVNGNVNNGLRTLRWNWGNNNISSAGTVFTLNGTSSVLGIPQNAAVFINLESDMGQNITIQSVWMQADAVAFRIRCSGCTIGNQAVNLNNLHYTFIW